MKTVNLAKKILRHIVKEYKATQNTSFDFSVIKNKFSNHSDEELCNALRMLNTDGFVKIFWADNIAYTTTLLPDGIRNCEEDTWYAKGYSLVKEIKRLLS